MKKKVILSVLAIILSVALVFGVTSVYGEGFADLETPVDAENIATTKLESIVDKKESNKALKSVDGNTNTVWKSSKPTDSLVITFNDETTFNTVVIREKGWNITDFSLSYYVDTPGNEHWVRFYKQDSVGDYRYCTFESVTAKQLKFDVASANSRFKISEIEVYNNPRKDIENFRVSDYLVTPQLANGEIFDPQSSNYYYPEYYDIINQIHIIAAAKWNDEGELVISDGLSGDELKSNIQRLRENYGDRKVEIFATVFFNNCNPDIVLTEYKEDVINNTVEFLQEYGFDGVSYDWEYPNKQQWEYFSEHIVNLKNELSKYEMKVSCAVCPWNFYMSKEAINAIDQIEVMSYDLFDNNGNHSSFASGAVQPIEYFLDKGFKAEQIDLGLPFYARPKDGTGVWINFDDPNYTPADRFENYSDGMWFSGTQMTMDKTSYAIDKGLGGMMIFTSNEDVNYSNENSLLKSLKTTLDIRTTLNNVEKG